MTIPLNQQTSLVNKLTEVVHEINNALSGNHTETENVDLLSGYAGVALFKMNYIRHFLSNSQSVDNSFILEPINKFSAFQDLTNTSPNFCGGISGILWYIKYLNSLDILEIDTEDVISSFKSYLLETILNYIDNDNFDFFYGACGIFMVLMEYQSLSTSEIEQIEKKILLKEVKIDKNESTFFFKFKKEVDSYDMGMAHGLCAFISIFSKHSHNSDIVNAVSNSINFINSNRNKTIQHALFPYSVTKNVEKKTDEDSRLAWCYGDLSIALAFWNAGKNLKQEVWKQKAIEIMLHSAKRKDLKENGIVDASICHGTAGVAHIFNYFFKQTKIEEFDHARWYWLEQTLQMKKFDDGLAGFKTLQGNGWQSDLGLLEGISGIGLVLLEFLNEDTNANNLNWDGSLLFM